MIDYSGHQIESGTVSNTLFSGDLLFYLFGTKKTTLMPQQLPSPPWTPQAELGEESAPPVMRSWAVRSPPPRIGPPGFKAGAAGYFSAVSMATSFGHSKVVACTGPHKSRSKLL